jgi:hypothetical protein
VGLWQLWGVGFTVAALVLAFAITVWLGMGHDG